MQSVARDRRYGLPWLNRLGGQEQACGCPRKLLDLGGTTELVHFKVEHLLLGKRQRRCGERRNVSCVARSLQMDFASFAHILDSIDLDIFAVKMCVH